METLTLAFVALLFIIGLLLTLWVRRELRDRAVREQMIKETRPIRRR